MSAKALRAVAKLPRADIAFFSALGLFAILPLLFPRFIAHDGPSHMATGNVLLHLFRHDDPLLSQFYMLRPWSITNSFVHYLAAAMLAVTPSSFAAERVIVALLIWFVPFAAWRVAVQFPRQNPWILLSLVPFGFSLTLIIGNYNTMFSLGFFFLAFAVLVRCRGEFGVRDGVEVAILLAAAAWAHPLGILYMVGRGGPFALVAAFVASRQQGLLSRDSIVRRLVAPVLAVLPALAILMMFVFTDTDPDVIHDPPSRYPGPGLSRRLQLLAAIRQLYTLDPRQIALGLILAAILIALGALVVASRRRDPRLLYQDGGIAAAAGATLIYLFIPNSGAGSFNLTQRLDDYPWLLAIIWLSWFPAPQWSRRLEIGALPLILAGYWLTVEHALAQIVADERTYLAVLGQIEPNSVVLPINVARNPVIDGQLVETYQNTYFQLHEHVGIAKNAIMLQDWNAEHLGFPVKFKQRVGPLQYLRTLGPRLGNIAAYEQGSGHRLDYVFLWAPDADLLPDGSAAGLLSLLAADYQLVTREESFGRAALLYKRRSEEPR